jgi:hypothetical protein
MRLWKASDYRGWTDCPGRTSIASKVVYRSANNHDDVGIPGGSVSIKRRCERNCLSRGGRSLGHQLLAATRRSCDGEFHRPVPEQGRSVRQRILIPP